MLHLSDPDGTRVELDQRRGYPPHIRITRGGRLIVNGYIAPDAALANVERSVLGRHERSRPTAPTAGDTDASLEDRLMALAADMAREAPFTAEILRQFAADAAQLQSALAELTGE